MLIPFSPSPIKVTYINGCKIYLDIMPAEKLLSIQVAKLDIMYWSVTSSFRRRGVKKVGGGPGVVVLASG